MPRKGALRGAPNIAHEESRTRTTFGRQRPLFAKPQNRNRGTAVLFEFQSSPAKELDIKEPERIISVREWHPERLLMCRSTNVKGQMTGGQ